MELRVLAMAPIFPYYLYRRSRGFHEGSHKAFRYYEGSCKRRTIRSLPKPFKECWGMLSGTTKPVDGRRLSRFTGKF